MDTHRPYGRGDDALPPGLDSKASGAGPKRTQRSLTAAEHEEVLRHYRVALRRTSERLAAFLRELPTETVAVVAGDHGEEFGEEGYYYHGGYRRRLVDALVSVPVWTRGLTLDSERIGLVDVAPVLCGRARLPPPGEWDGSPNGRSLDHGVLSVAPWNQRASLRWQNRSATLTVSNGAVDWGEASNPVAAVDESVEEQLRALGYVGSG